MFAVKTRNILCGCAGAQTHAHTQTLTHTHTYAYIYITVYIKYEYLELGIQRKHGQVCLILTLAPTHDHLFPTLAHEDE